MLQPVLLFRLLQRTEPSQITSIVQRITSLASPYSIRHFTSDFQNFENLGISKRICQHLSTAFRIDKPTNVQRQLIPAICSGKDVLLRDSTGTGKSFAIALS